MARSTFRSQHAKSAPFSEHFSAVEKVHVAGAGSTFGRHKYENLTVCGALFEVRARFCVAAGDG